MVKVPDMLIHGLERPIILWLLSHRPRHGYELILEFKRLTGRKLKPSIVYPFLHKLERNGFASGKWVEKGRRRIRYYSLTTKGEDLLRRIRKLFNKPLREVLLDMVSKRESSS